MKKVYIVEEGIGYEDGSNFISKVFINFNNAKDYILNNPNKYEEVKEDWVKQYYFFYAYNDDLNAFANIVEMEIEEEKVCLRCRKEEILEQEDCFMGKEIVDGGTEPHIFKEE